MSSVAMSNVAMGSLPEKICYVHSNKKIKVNVGCEWDFKSDNDKLQTQKVDVFYTFPADNSDKKMLERAEKWATLYDKDVSFDVINNAPIQNVNLLSLEERGNGGRAYKVIIGDYYVDLREDVLMDVLLQTGVAPGGVLQGEFIWSKQGAQMKLIRVGSELHRLISEYDSKKDIKPIDKNDLEVGGVYQTKRKEKAIFVGYVNTTVYKTFNDKKLKAYNRKDVDVKYDFKIKKLKKAMLFYKI